MLLIINCIMNNNNRNTNVKEFAPSLPFRIRKYNYFRPSKLIMKRRIQHNQFFYKANENNKLNQTYTEEFLASNFF